MTGIEWTDRSDWNAIRGCTRESEGCRNCYAEAIAARFSGPGQPFEGFAERTAGGPRWTGKIELIEDRLTLPLRWRKPARIFANSAFDLFHESVPDAWIDRVFAVMALCPHHTFQILTKRAKRMREYLSDHDVAYRILCAAERIDHKSLNNRFMWSIESRDEDRGAVGTPARWPLPNVWLGVSAEDQRRADERIPYLLATPAAIRFVSAEPLLGPIDFRQIGGRDGDGFNAFDDGADDGVRAEPILDWIIVGGESGPNARPMQIPWARSILGQCRAAGVACFVKQLGTEPIWEDGAFLNLRHGKGADMSEWPSDLRVQEFPNAR